MVTLAKNGTGTGDAIPKIECFELVHMKPTKGKASKPRMLLLLDVNWSSRLVNSAPGSVVNTIEQDVFASIA